MFADYCDGDLRILQPTDDGHAGRTLLRTDLHVASFAEDPQGESLIVDRGGSLLRLAPAP